MPDPAVATFVGRLATHETHPRGTEEAEGKTLFDFDVSGGTDDWIVEVVDDSQLAGWRQYSIRCVVRNVGKFPGVATIDTWTEVGQAPHMTTPELAPGEAVTTGEWLIELDHNNHKASIGLFVEPGRGVVYFDIVPAPAV